jgi:NAD+ kinase
VKRVGILYHPLREKARDLSQRLEEFLSSKGVSSWRCSAWDEDKATPQVAGTELILSIGGDGTILHSARIAASLSVPVLGINLGRLGFITEMDADEVMSRLPGLLKGKSWIEERAMLEARVGDKSFHALNDVVLHSVAVRLVNIEAKIDGTVLTT